MPYKLPNTFPTLHLGHVGLRLLCWNTLICSVTRGTTISCRTAENATNTLSFSFTNGIRLHSRHYIVEFVGVFSATKQLMSLRV